MFRLFHLACSVLILYESVSNVGRIYFLFLLQCQPFYEQSPMLEHSYSLEVLIRWSFSKSTATHNALWAYV